MLVPTLHLRNVPPEVYEALAARAQQNGRSLNAEAVDVLRESLKRRSFEEVMRDINEHAAKLGFDESWPKPEDLIREDRDSR